jgi:hypothetical protein
MENTPLEYSEAVEKTAFQIKSIHARGFEINYRHLPHSEIEIRFIKKVSLNNQGIVCVATILREGSCFKANPTQHGVHNPSLETQRGLIDGIGKTI